MVGVTDRPEPGVILTHRPHGMRQHAGQIAFPGGKLDPGEDAIAAALRETHEELGIHPSHIAIVGVTDRFVTGTGYDITPVIGLMAPDLPILPNPHEVSEWFEAPLRFVLDPANRVRKQAEFRGVMREFTEIVWEGHRIWGVTAAIIENLSEPAGVGGFGRWLTCYPPARWTRRADLAQLVAALGPGNARWVGGAVRDTLLGIEAADVDCATPLKPQDVIARLGRAGIRSVPTGIEHGTVTALTSEGKVEITTLRRDVSTDGRRATIEYTSRWEEDAARRDFTINALYADPVTHELFDYFGGIADLAARRVRFIGDARQRIREDHLRILRYYRFQARFGSELDPEAEEACAELAATLKGLSRERVAMELLNLLGLPDPSATLLRMQQRGVLGEVLPEATPASIATLVRLAAAEADLAVAPDPIRHLAALLPLSRPVAENVAARLRLAKAQRFRLACAAERGEQDALAPRALAYREGIESAVDRLLLAGASIAPLAGWSLPELPLKGGEIVARGIKAGPEVARILRRVETRWIEEDFPARERVIELLASELPG